MTHPSFSFLRRNFLGIGNQEDIDDSDSADRNKSRGKKEARMTTNKKKSENFFTNANVKNKNRSRKIPKVESRKKKK
ncbi:hypothetical protein PSHT_08200 [Puccinia striiformis]|uniref:Uncharacterized protein n=1 Tax=Puccinia striiformis TaxID=27350 RepID=A0A2S4VRL9_9BASI|nr:hypothetical protein PSHT_08200 [Puccinia striiformis]